MDQSVVKYAPMSPAQVICAVLVPLLWGLQFVVIKIGLTAFPPLFFVGLRFAAVAALLLPFVGRPTRRELRPILVISIFFGGLNFGLVCVGLGQGLASVSAVANQLSTPFTVLLAWPLLGERPSPRVITGVALAFAGVVLTAAEPSASVKIVPTLLVIAAGFALAVGSVLAKRYGPFEPMKLTAWMSVFTVPQVMAASFLIEHGQFASLHTASLKAWLSFGYIVLFGAVAGWGLWFWLISRCSMERVAPFALLQIVFAVIAGIVFLHEPLTSKLVAGAAICIAGVAISQIRWSTWRAGSAARSRSGRSQENALKSEPFVARHQMVHAGTENIPAVVGGNGPPLVLIHAVIRLWHSYRGKLAQKQKECRSSSALNTGRSIEEALGRKALNRSDLLPGSVFNQPTN